MRLIHSSIFAGMIVLASGCGKEPDAPKAESRTQASVAPPIDPRSVGSVAGIVRLDGRPARRIITPPDAYCAAQNPKGIVMDAFVVGEGQTLADVFIQVRNGLGNRRFPSPSLAVVLDQVKCVYVPHVIALMTNQPLLVRNSDDTLHNVHGVPQRTREFNRAQSSKGMEDTFRFPAPETGIPVQCDLHPWMSAWVHVSDHPFFAVTKLDGRYAIPGLPPGDYEIVAWHERFPKAPRVAKIRIAAGQAATLDFTFEVTRR
jgi:hypothetical protein